jgi:hypothetical protein
VERCVDAADSAATKSRVVHPHKGNRNRYRIGVREWQCDVMG